MIYVCFCVCIYNLGSHVSLFAKSHTNFNAFLTGAAAITYLFPYLSFSLFPFYSVMQLKASLELNNLYENINIFLVAAHTLSSF